MKSNRKTTCTVHTAHTCTTQCFERETTEEKQRMNFEFFSSTEKTTEKKLPLLFYFVVSVYTKIYTHKF